MNNHEQEKFNRELTSGNGRGYHGGMAESPEIGRQNNPETSRQFQELLGKVENVETKQGLRVYSQLRSYESWGVEDYARANFMLGHDAGQNASEKEATKILAERLRGDANAKGLKIEDIIGAEAGFDDAENPKFLQQQEWGTASEERKKEDITNRAIAMNYELWKAMGASGELRRLSVTQLGDAFNYWNSLRQDTAGAMRLGSKEIADVLDSIAGETERRPAPAPTGGNGGNGNNGGMPPGGPTDGGTGGSEDNPLLEEVRGIRRNTAEIAKNTAIMIQQLESIRREIADITRELFSPADHEHPRYKDPEDPRFRAELLNATGRQEQAQRALSEMTGNEPWESWDRELYTGTVDEALVERMRRIEYFRRMREVADDQPMPPDDLNPNGEDVRLDVPDANPYDKDIDPNAKDIDPEATIDSTDTRFISEERDRRRREVARRIPIVEERKRRKRGREEEKAFRRRALSAYQEVGREGSVEKEKEYFKELQRWAGKIVKSSEYEGGSGTLKNLSEDEYKVFKAVSEEKFVTNSQPDNDATIESKMKDYIKKLGENNFLAYFQNAEYKPSMQGQRMESAGYLPVSLEETMGAIVRTWGTEGWGPGGEHELVDIEGNFHLDNFAQWYRTRTVELSDADPFKAIDPLNAIRLRIGWSELSIVQMLVTPQYLQHREFEIKGDVRAVKEGRGSLQTGWGNPKDHPDLEYKRKIDMVIELWRVGMKQADWVKLNQLPTKNKREDWLNAQYDIVNDNNYFRSSFYLDRDLKLAKNGEAEAYYAHGKQGSLGKAIRDGTLFFRHLTEFTEFYAAKDHDGKVTGVRGLEDNMAYSSLDYDGSSALLLGVAEGALNRADAKGLMDEIDPNGKFVPEPDANGDPALDANGNTIIRKKSGDLKDAYKNFLIRQIGKYKYDEGVELTDDQRSKANLYVAEYKKKVANMPLHEMTISFDSSKELEELAVKLGGVVGKTSKTDKKTITNELKSKMRANIAGDFFKEVMELEMVDEDENELGEKLKIDPTKPKIKIGDQKVYLSARLEDGGRIVTQKEWREMGGKDEDNKTTVRRIMGDFGNNFTEDHAKLEGFEKNDDFKLKEREYDDAEVALGRAEAAARRDATLRTEVDRCRHELGVKKAARDIVRAPYEKILARNESMGLAMLTKVANVSRKGLNTFRSANPDKRAEDIMRDSLRKSISTVYGLNETEGKYAYQNVWYTTKQLMLSSWNNTSGVTRGVDQGTNFNRTMEVRATSFGLGTAGGDEATYEEIKAMVAPTRLDMTPVKKMGEGAASLNLLEVMQGTMPGEGRKIRHRWDSVRSLDDSQKFSIDTETMRAHFLNAFQEANTLFHEMVEEQHLSFHQLVKKNALGVPEFDHKAGRELINKWWNSLRLVYNVNNIDFDTKIAVDGREVSMLEHMMGRKTRLTLEVLKEYYEKKNTDLNSQADSRLKPPYNKEKIEKLKHDAKAYEEYARKIKEQPAIAILTSLVAITIHEHMNPRSNQEDWSLNEVGNMWWILDHYLREAGGFEYHGNDPHVKHKPSLLPFGALNEVMARIDKNKSSEWYMFRDLFVNFINGLGAGIIESVNETLDEFVQVEKVYGA